MSEQTMVEAVGGVIHTGCQEDRDPYDVARDVLTVVSRMTRQSCTPSAEAYQAGGDTLIYAVADWIAPVTEQGERTGVVAEEPAWPDWTAEQVAAAHAAFWAHPDATGGPEAIRAALNAACAAWVPVKQEGQVER